MKTLGITIGCLATACLISTATFAQERQEQSLKLHPKNGYTLQQTLALHKRFDLGTWNSGEDIDLSRFAYLNTAQILPHASIPRADQVSVLESAPNDGIGKIRAKTAEGEMTLERVDSEISRRGHRGPRWQDYLRTLSAYATER